SDLQLFTLHVSTTGALGLCSNNSALEGLLQGAEGLFQRLWNHESCRCAHGRSLRRQLHYICFGWRTISSRATPNTFAFPRTIFRALEVGLLCRTQTSERNCQVRFKGIFIINF